MSNALESVFAPPGDGVLFHFSDDGQSGTDFLSFLDAAVANVDHPSHVERADPVETSLSLFDHFPLSTPPDPLALTPPDPAVVGVIGRMPQRAPKRQAKFPAPALTAHTAKPPPPISVPALVQVGAVSHGFYDPGAVRTYPFRPSSRPVPKPKPAPPLPLQPSLAPVTQVIPPSTSSVAASAPIAKPPATISAKPLAKPAPPPIPEQRLERLALFAAHLADRPCSTCLSRGAKVFHCGWDPLLLRRRYCDPPFLGVIPPIDLAVPEFVERWNGHDFEKGFFVVGLTAPPVWPEASVCRDLLGLPPVHWYGGTEVGLYLKEYKAVPFDGFARYWDGDVLCPWLSRDGLFEARTNMVNLAVRPGDWFYSKKDATIIAGGFKNGDVDLSLMGAVRCGTLTFPFKNYCEDDTHQWCQITGDVSTFDRLFAPPGRGYPVTAFLVVPEAELTLRAVVNSLRLAVPGARFLNRVIFDRLSQVGVNVGDQAMIRTIREAYAAVDKAPNAEQVADALRAVALSRDWLKGLDSTPFVVA